MRKATKFVSVLLIGAMMLPMTACVKKVEKTSSSVDEEIEATADSSEEAEEVLPAKAMVASSEVNALLEELASASSDSESASASVSESSVSASSAADAGDQIFGVISGDCYTNEAFNFKFQPECCFEFATDEEMLETNDMEGGQWTDEAKKAAIGKGKTFYDLYATSEDPYQTVIVILKDAIFDVQAAGGLETLMDEDVRASVEKELEGEGYENCKVEKSTVNFLGDPNAPAFKITADLYGMKVYETMVFVVNGHYFATITTASLEEDSTQTILDSFTKIK